MKEVRFERKFILHKDEAYRVKNLTSILPVKIHHPTRWVNSLYFGSTNYSTLENSIEGDNLRQKVRLRWYGDNTLAINKPRLELKSKHGDVVTKTVFDLDLDLNSFSNIKELTKELNFKIKNNEVASTVLKLNPLPILLNSYQRDYFLSFDKKIRLTLDYNLSSMNALTAFKKIKMNKSLLSPVVVEVKYNVEDSEHAEPICHILNSRQTNHSKLTNQFYNIYDSKFFNQ